MSNTETELALFRESAAWARNILSSYLAAESQEERDYLFKDLEHAHRTLDAALDEREWPLAIKQKVFAHADPYGTGRWFVDDDEEHLVAIFDCGTPRENEERALIFAEAYNLHCQKEGE